MFFRRVGLQIQDLVLKKKVRNIHWTIWIWINVDIIIVFVSTKHIQPPATPSFPAFCVWVQFHVIDFLGNLWLPCHRAVYTQRQYFACNCLLPVVQQLVQHRGDVYQNQALHVERLYSPVYYVTNRVWLPVFCQSLDTNHGQIHSPPAHASHSPYQLPFCCIAVGIVPVALLTGDPHHIYNAP